MSKEYNSIYLGIVVQNNDPEKRGRVKVYVPHISANVYEKWMEDKLDKKFKFPGANLNSDITPILQDLKIILPWAETVAPLMSENSSGRFNNFNLVGSISDSNFLTNFTEASTNAPGAAYEESYLRLNDAFNGDKSETNYTNPYSYMYKPNVYTNKAKGSFGIPSVGSHVYVFFREGNPLFPVLMGASFSKSDWEGVYDSNLDYPGKYENYDAANTEEDVNVNNYRNKYILNQKGGVFEIVNSDLNEKIKLTHYSGSFKEFNNQTNIELASKNDQKLVLNDQFSTVQGNKSNFTGKNLDVVVKRDSYKKVGNLNKEYFKQWKDIANVIQDNKQLFEIRRTVNNDVKDSDGNVIIKRNSLDQKREGTFANFPVTDGTLQYKALNNTNSAPGISIPTANNSAASLNVVKDNPDDENPAEGRWNDESGKGWGPGGAGKSISSENGTWDIETDKENLKTIIESNLKELTNIELELGLGGSELIEIAKHKLETIGTVMNDFGSFRLDKIGKLINNEVLVDDLVTYLNKSESPLLEYVHVQDLPGGNYTLNVSNRYNVLVGAGGLNFKSYGPVNISGTITNIAGEQINMGSDNEINIDSNTINISAEILRLRNKRQRQILIDNSLGVNNNVIIGGGLFVEGETYLQHVTAPREYQVTETATAGLKTGSSFTAVGPWTGTGTITICTSNNDVVCAHSHVFANLPLTLKDNNCQVRTDAKTNNINSGSIRTTSSPQHNEKK